MKDKTFVFLALGDWTACAKTIVACKPIINSPLLCNSLKTLMPFVEQVEDGNLDPKEAGVKGLSIINRVLPYLSVKTTWLMPVLHALLYGVAQKFVQVILDGNKGHSERVKASIDLPRKYTLII